MKRPDLEIPTHEGHKFTWGDGTGVAEASDFGPHGTVWMAQVWSDACDVGFNIRSHKTGSVKLFTLVNEESHEGELVSWVFRSEDGVEVVVLND